MTTLDDQVSKVSKNSKCPKNSEEKYSKNTKNKIFKQNTTYDTTTMVWEHRIFAVLSFSSHLLGGKKKL